VKIENRFTENKQQTLRKLFHIGFSIVLIAVIVSFEYVIKDASVINKLFVFAGYTYGPLLGMFGFGILTKLKVNHQLIPFIAIASPFITYLISYLSSTYGGFEFGFFILLLNGAITFLGMFLGSLFSNQNTEMQSSIV
jgi:hypothetical protein